MRLISPVNVNHRAAEYHGTADRIDRAGRA
jgi:hypothetical protein